MVSKPTILVFLWNKSLLMLLPSISTQFFQNLLFLRFLNYFFQFCHGLNYLVSHFCAQPPQSGFLLFLMEQFNGTDLPLYRNSFLKFSMSSSGHSKLSSHDHNQFWKLLLASKYICLKHIFPLLLPTVFCVWEASHLFCSLLICQLHKLIKLDPHRFEEVAQCLEH